MPGRGHSRTVTTVSTRTPVFIYAADPLSAAGAKAQLLGEPSIELVGPVDLDRARVALVVAEAADESVAKVARAIQRDGVPHVVLVAAHFEETGVVTAVAAGVSGFLRRTEATTARLVELIRQADRAGCQLPEGLLRRAASVQLHTIPGRPDVIDLPEPAGPEGRCRPRPRCGCRGGRPKSCAWWPTGMTPRTWRSSSPIPKAPSKGCWRS